jgi:hypothetical protein
MNLNYLKLILLCILLKIHLIQATNVKQMIENIPLEDRKELEGLFYNLINDQPFSYTLFGDKPVSIASYFRVTPWENFIELGQCDGIVLKKWKIWEKYKNQFPFKNYYMFKENSSNFEEIILMNKKEFLKTLVNHLDIFEKILGKKIDPEEFLRKIGQGKISFYDSIQSNEILLGIFFGYGKYNPILFSQRNKILKDNGLNVIGYDDGHSLQRIGSSIHFIGDLNHPETKALQRKYQKFRGKISAIYAKGNFLEITLSKLISD